MMVNIYRFIRIILLIFFLLLSIIFFVKSGAVFVNYLWGFSPDKISAEYQITLLFGFSYLLGGVIFFFLFIGFLLYKVWFLSLLWISFLLYILILFFMVGPSSFFESSEIVGLGLAIIIPFIVGLYITISIKKYFQKNNSYIQGAG